MHLLKRYLHHLYKKTTDLNFQNILSQLEVNPKAKLLDLGCDDGKKTIAYANKIHTDKIYGIEIVGKQAKKAIKKGIKVRVIDMNKSWPYPNNFFDAVIANQVIEHVSNIDHFVSEMKRVLRKGGYAIISTENGSSWHNIFAAIMGWQIFSLTNISSKKSGIGNPLALHRNETLKFSSWTHKTIFNFLGLKELFQLYNFKCVSCRGSGYYPFPSLFGKYDTKHSHYLSIKVIKQ